MKKNQLSHSPERAFTLIELLVVITIITILAMIGFATFSNARKRAEDAKLISNVKAIQQAMEQAFDSSTGAGVYNRGIAEGTFETGSFPDVSSGDITVTMGGTSAYCVKATLLDNQAGNCSGCNCGTDSCTITPGVGSFCAKNMQ